MNELQTNQNSDDCSEKTQTKGQQEEQFEKHYSIELFFYNLPQLALIFACVFIFARILNKYIEAVVFLFSFFTLRYKFNTTFHYENVLYCILTTILMFTASVIFSPPLTISLFGCVLFAFFDTWLLWFIQDRFEFKLKTKLLEAQNKEMNQELTDIKSISIWEMDEPNLRTYLYTKGIRDDRQDFVVMIIIDGLKFEEIAKKLGYSVDTLKDWSPICKKILGIKSWKRRK